MVHAWEMQLRISHIYHEGNKSSDGLANFGFDVRHDRCRFDAIADCIKDSFFRNRFMIDVIRGFNLVGTSLFHSDA
ncbi:unnamed protein product [Sphenostylis stenocarpa]|uniref:RNase H type-1 domain-containing protein n=1 Tax=Sphenostylis stenocarpa TaxID=92480 RepID=A0AA86VRV4_9FABA|nr:unnamed protein product [Sphenostylis stenocarpa]